MIEAVAAERGWSWSVELVHDPDPLLAASTLPVVTSDAGILNHGCPHVALVSLILETIDDSRVWLIDLSS